MSTQSEPTSTPKKKRVHAGGVAKGYKQSPEHVATLKAKRDKIMRAKKKLGLQWKDPLPADHPLASKAYDPAKRKANYEKAKASTPDSLLTPEQLKKRKDNAEYRARKRAEQGKPPPKEYGTLAEGTAASLNPEKIREWQRNYRARKKAEKLARLPVEGKRSNGHANGDSVIHDLLPIGKGSIGVAHVRRHMPDPMLLMQGMPAGAPGSRAARVIGLMEMWTVLLREELAKE